MSTYAHAAGASLWIIPSQPGFTVWQAVFRLICYLISYELKSTILQRAHRYFMGKQAIRIRRQIRGQHFNGQCQRSIRISPVCCYF